MMKLFSLTVAMVLMAIYPVHSEIRLCTGGSSGVYYAAGEAIAKMGGPKLGIKVIETEGTLDNLTRMIETPADDGDACDAMIGQPDGAVYVSRKSPASAKKLRKVAVLHREYLHVLCSKASGVDDLGDIVGSKGSIAIGEPGSGAWLIWQNIISEDDSYGSVPISNEGGDLALSAVSSDVTTCMLVPAGLHNGIVNEADDLYGDSLVLADANDKDFNDAKDIDGKPLYEYVDIPSGTYGKSLQTGFFGSSISTISWNAGVYVNTERFPDSKTLSAFISATAKAAIGVKAEYGK